MLVNWCHIKMVNIQYGHWVYQVHSSINFIIIPTFVATSETVILKGLL